MAVALFVCGSVFSSLHGVFRSTPVLVAADVLIGLAVLLWLGLAFRVGRDARRRIDDAWLVATATLLGLALPFLGPLVYMLFRPSETLAEIRSRTAELRLLERYTEQESCPECGTPVRSSYLVCPVCVSRIRQACTSCAAPLEPDWRTCPYCEQPIRAPGEEPPSAGLDAALAAPATGANGRHAGSLSGSRPGAA